MILAYQTFWIKLHNFTFDNGTAPPGNIPSPTEKRYLVPTGPPTRWNTKRPPTTVIILLLLFLLFALSSRPIIPYILNGPQFTTFFAIYTIYILLTHSPYLLHKQHHAQTIAIHLRPLPFSPLPLPPALHPLITTVINVPPNTRIQVAIVVVVTVVVACVKTVKQTIHITLKRKQNLQSNPNNL